MSSADTVGDFSYKVGGEYYSGRLSISDSNTLADYAPRILIGRKISTHYNPQKPKEFFVAPANIDGFSIGQHTDEILQSDLDPTVLNIDKD